MKRNALSLFAMVAAALLLTGAGREGGGAFGGRAAERGSSTLYRRKRVTVPRPSAPEHQVEDRNNHVAYPQRDGKGAAISKPAAIAPPSHHVTVARNAGFVRGIEREQRGEMTPNHYYWHNSGGVRYSHYYDGHNHWYGFYHGPSFYWTRYNAGRWWWFDGRGSRWVYWWDGFWWWPGPGGAAYVYVDNNYYPYEGQGVTAQYAEVQTPPASIPAPSADAATASPDGRRTVQITGADAQAFLYDKTTNPPTFLKYLGQGASKVRFSGGTAGAPLQVLVEFKDGTFALYDDKGESQSSAVQTGETGTAPPADTPDSIPPPPTSAPGQ